MATKEYRRLWNNPLRVATKMSVLTGHPTKGWTWYMVYGWVLAGH